MYTAQWRILFVAPATQGPLAQPLTGLLPLSFSPQHHTLTIPLPFQVVVGPKPLFCQCQTPCFFTLPLFFLKIHLWFQVVVGRGCLDFTPYSLKYEGDFDCLTVKILTGAFIGGTVLLLVVVVACCCCCRKLKKRKPGIVSQYPGYNEVGTSFFPDAAMCQPCSFCGTSVGLVFGGALAIWFKGVLCGEKKKPKTKSQGFPWPWSPGLNMSGGEFGSVKLSWIYYCTFHMRFGLTGLGTPFCIPTPSNPTVRGRQKFPIPDDLPMFTKH